MLPAAEGQRPGERSRRIALLRRNSTAQSRLVHQLFATVEGLLTIAIVCMPLWFSPDFTAKLKEIFTQWQAAAGTGKRDLLVLAYFLAMSISEPIYVAAGFMLYLNRRTDLEAWDMEIALRQLAGRLARKVAP